MKETPTTQNTPVQIIDDGGDRKYWTQIPNIVFSLGLSPFELTLYVYLKKVAGASGACWQRTGTLADATNMSDGMISKAKAGLSRPRAELNGKALIVIAEEKNRHGGKNRHVIRLSDIWPENFAMFGRPISQDEQAISPHEIAISPHEQAISPHEIKKNPSEEKPREGKHTHTRAPLASVPAPPPRSADAGVCVSPTKSRFSFEERKAHAAANGLGSGWLTNSRDGRYDELIADAQTRCTPEAIEQALTTPERPGMAYGAALMLIASVVSAGGPGSEPAPEIERLFETGQISAETRERLLARDWTAKSAVA
jgi:hypothetical protein